MEGEVRPPTRKEEAWRFTDLGKLYSKKHESAPAVLPMAQMDEIKAKIAEHTLEVCAGQVLVFVDGVYRAELSQTANLVGHTWKAGSIRDFEVCIFRTVR